MLPVNKAPAWDRDGFPRKAKFSAQGKVFRARQMRNSCFFWKFVTFRWVLRSYKTYTRSMDEYNIWIPTDRQAWLCDRKKHNPWKTFYYLFELRVQFSIPYLMTLLDHQPAVCTVDFIFILDSKVESDVYRTLRRSMAFEEIESKQCASKGSKEHKHLDLCATLWLFVWLKSQFSHASLLSDMKYSFQRNGSSIQLQFSLVRPRNAFCAINGAAF